MPNASSPPADDPASSTRPPPGRPSEFSRILLKLSGEAFCSRDGFGICPDAVRHIAEEIHGCADLGVQIAVVVGGGNIIRGAELSSAGDIPQATADYMGMLGTVINALALREHLTRLGIDSRVMSAIEIKAVAEPFIRGRAIRHLEKGRVVILAAGTGNPFFTTDTCAALRATELECELLLKATKVDGVYTADPVKDPHAQRLEHLSFTEALQRGLRVMDITALAMCQEHGVPVLVFDFRGAGNIRRVISGENLGTFVYQEPAPA